MKEQIILLDPYDDFYSARDKMGWTQTGRLLLVWPADGRVLSRRLDLVLLHRHARRLGAALAVIAEDPEVRDHARELGLPAFETIEESRRHHWRTRIPRPLVRQRNSRTELTALRPPPPLVDWSSLPIWLSWTLRGLFFVIGLGAPAVLAYTLIPSATISITPTTHTLRADVDIIADANLTHSVPPNQIPARRVQIEVETSGFTPATGQVDVPARTATGTVVFTNLIGLPTTIPQGTGLRTTTGSSVRFVTLTPATLEGRLNATVEVPIQAVEAGPAGNVSAGQINAIDGPLGLQLAVTNPLPTEGGSVTTAPAVTAADRFRLRRQLLEQLRATGMTRMESQLQPGEFLVNDSVRIKQVLAESYDVAEGEPADAVWLTLRLALSGLAVNEADAAHLAEAALIAQLPPGQRLLPDRTKFSRQPNVYLDGQERAHFSITAQGVAVSLIDPVQVRQLARNQPPAIARQRLSNYLPLAQPPEIVIFPNWYGRVPWLEFRIDVIVQ